MDKIGKGATWGGLGVAGAGAAATLFTGGLGAIPAAPVVVGGLALSLAGQVASTGAGIYKGYLGNTSALASTGLGEVFSLAVPLKFGLKGAPGGAILGLAADQIASKDFKDSCR